MLTPEQLKEFEDKHGRIAHLHGCDCAWELVLRKPTRVEYSAFRKMGHNDARKADAQETLVRCIAVYPDKMAVDSLLEDWPGIPEAATKAIIKLTGMAVDEDLK